MAERITDEAPGRIASPLIIRDEQDTCAMTEPAAHAAGSFEIVGK